MTGPPHQSNSLRLLSFDGGGVPGLSSLIILYELMKRAQTQLDLPNVPRPCEMFDVIAGTGTGGIIAILLGRLGLQVEDAIEAYQQIIKDAFSERKLSGEGAFKTTNLENSITRLVVRQTGRSDTPMMAPRGSGCKTFVCAMQADNMTAGIPILIRTYSAPENDGPKCRITQAALATAVTMGYFKPITINDSGIGVTYIDGGMSGNNPTAHMLAEVGQIFPDRNISCVFSIGSGHLRPISLKSKDLGLTIAQDSERVAQEMARRFQYTADVYFRFNVDQGMQNIGVTNWEKMPEVVSHTQQYIKLFEVTSKLTQAAKALATPPAFVPAKQLNIFKALQSCPLPSASFVGQEGVLTQMDRCIFDDTGGRHIFVLYGLGGAGKTQLALKFTQLYRSKFSEVFYIDASSANTIEADLASFAVHKKSGKSHDSAIEWLAGCQERWLLILNNADDTSLSLQQYFPPCSHGDILITTRNRQLISYAQGTNAYCQIARMALEDGKKLLLKRSRVAWDDVNDKLAEAIVTELGSLALAIAQAGAYICVHECGLAAYLDMYREYQGELLEQYKDLTQKLDDYQWTVFTTWRVSLRKLSPRAVELFYLLAFMHHDRILEETLRRACLKISSNERVALTEEYLIVERTVIDFLSAFRLNGSWYRPAFFSLVTEIRSYSLIDFDPTSGYYSIHPLVHSWIRTTVGQIHEAERRTTILLALSIDNEFGADDHEYRAKLVSHIDALSTEFKSDPNIARKFAMVYDEAGRFQVAKSLREAVVKADKQILGVDHPETFTDMLDLANACLGNGELREAEKLHIAVLEGRTRVLGEVHTDTYRAMAYLALTYHDQSRHQEAKVLQVKVLEAAKELLGPEARETLLSQLALATTYQSLGRLYEAKSLFVESVEVQKRVLGASHPATLTTMHNLAGLLELLDELDDAETLAAEVLQARRHISGEDHPDTLSILGVVAGIKWRRGQYEEAAKIQEHLHETQRHTLGELHPQTLCNRANLACSYQSLGRFVEAEKIYQQVLEAKTRIHSREYPDMTSNISNLASVYSSLGRQAEAENIMVEELAIRSRTSGDSNTPIMAVLKINLAELYVKQRRWKEAEVLMREAVATRTAIYGSEHFQVKLCLQTLSEIESALWRESVMKYTYYLVGLFVALLSIAVMCS
ncbi:nephrocystin-3 protein [Rhizoctonia solani 123E]|uniref:Nephrocystin-3 protein n=1 Tax=Rhizoctonia solani 123E TaxID=1423351 RepID=A0A074RUX3_9AGAM|nr:nephrocystin-3 protein [Rhizoctonia solani 123E]